MSACTAIPGHSGTTVLTLVPSEQFPARFNPKPKQWGRSSCCASDGLRAAFSRRVVSPSAYLHSARTFVYVVSVSVSTLAFCLVCKEKGGGSTGELFSCPGFIGSNLDPTFVSDSCVDVGVFATPGTWRA